MYINILLWVAFFFSLYSPLMTVCVHMGSAKAMYACMYVCLLYLHTILRVFQNINNASLAPGKYICTCLIFTYTLS